MPLLQVSLIAPAVVLWYPLTDSSFPCARTHAGRGEEAGRLMIERARYHQCEDPEGFTKGISKIVDEAVGSHLKLGMYSALVDTVP